jgi:ectoine hydroxylase-related dioxygenase (phytanoyl-CoA dioxygenase family)
MSHVHLVPPDQTVEHFRAHGWMRIPKSFSAGEAAAMREVVWCALEKIGIQRDDPSTWTKERPEHLQHLKGDPVFRAVGAKCVLDMIEVLLEAQPYVLPKSWGAFFIGFPTTRDWEIPRSGWHCDAHYMSSLSPPAGVKIHTLFGDVGPRCGGTQFLSGSHRLVHKWFQQHPQPETRGADMRKSLQKHPYIRDLHTENDPEKRIARFMDSVEEVDGIPLRVIENTGAAGDVILLHPLVLHVAAPNTGAVPRFLLSGSVDTDAMWPSKSLRG